MYEERGHEEKEGHLKDQICDGMLVVGVPRRERGAEHRRKPDTRVHKYG